MKKGFGSFMSLQETLLSAGISLSRPHKKASNPTLGFGQRHHRLSTASKQDPS